LLRTVCTGNAPLHPHQHNCSEHTSLLCQVTVESFPVGRSAQLTVLTVKAWLRNIHCTHVPTDPINIVLLLW